MGISEKLAERLVENYDVFLVSDKSAMLSRLLDIVWTLISIRFKIVHIDVFSTRAFSYAEIASYISRKQNVPVVLTLHGGMLTEKHAQESQRVERLLQTATVVQSPSKFLIEYFSRQDIVIEYMPNFIDQGSFPYRREEVKPMSLLWVRAFSDIYQPEMAVRVLAELSRKHPRVTLTMIGPDKGSEKSTRMLAQKLGVYEQIEFIGQVANESLYKYYNSHSVYLNTTRYESFGVAVLEAASCGIPIVSTKIGEIPYMWDEGIEMFMVDLGDSREMANKVTSLFSSISLANALSIKARKKSENFDWSQIESKWIDVLDGKHKEMP